MASIGNIEALLGGLEEKTKRVMLEVVRAFLPNLRAGPVEHQAKLENFQRYYVNSTTNSTANDEFTVLHGMGRAPYACRQVLALDQIGAKEVRLEVTRAADTVRVYLKSPEASAQITLELE
jgi:hypothetical protein